MDGAPVEYTHTQLGKIHWILIGFAILIASLSFQLPEGEEAMALTIMGIMVGIFLFFALSFRSLTVSDEGDCLAIVFGPLPIFRRRIHYDTMTDIKRSRSSIIDGWGIHYVPGRGWTFNLWGFDCVEIRQGKSITRVGSDDADRLAEFLKGKLRSAEATQPA